MRIVAVALMLAVAATDAADDAALAAHPFVSVVTGADGETRFVDASVPLEVRSFAPRILLDMVIVTARQRPLSVVGRDFLNFIDAELSAMAYREDTQGGET